MSNEIKMDLNQLSKSIALPITSVLQVFIWVFNFSVFFLPISFVFHTPYFLPIPHFPQSVFSVHLLITWLSHDHDELCSQSIDCLVGNIFRQNVLKRSVSVTMNLPVSLPLLMVAGLFISTSTISGNFDCFQVFNKHHFATSKVWYSLLNKL